MAVMRDAQGIELTLRSALSDPDNGVRSTVDLLIDRPWKRERLIRQQAIPADNIRVVRSLGRETNISVSFCAPSKRARAKCYRVSCK